MTNLPVLAEFIADKRQDMSTLIDTMTDATQNGDATTGDSNGRPSFLKDELGPLNGQAISPTQSRFPSQYRHIAVVHARQRTSCLSHDSTSTPSFLGFRNLMVIVLSRLQLQLGQLPRRMLTDTVCSLLEPTIDD